MSERRAMRTQSPTVIVLLGPTGSGKSHWAMQLAQHLPIEIISMDSAQVFRGLDLGTAKPEAAERAAVPHHLLDLRDPGESYSAGEFVRDAQAAIDAVHVRGRIPLVVGGTMLYWRALYRGIARLPQANPTLRARLDAEAAALGWPAMHARLVTVDAVAGARIHPNDAQRIQRALEVYEITGRPLSQWQQDTHGLSATYRWSIHTLWPDDRLAHGLRLAARFESMLRAGLADEVRSLFERGDLHAGLPAIRSVGYRQLWQWCMKSKSLPEACNDAVIATRQLAKRQLTWLRNDASIQKKWDSNNPDEFPDWKKMMTELLHDS
jgi:tRNA dimethylallyltransferase